MPFAVVVRWRVREGCEARVEALLREMQAASRAEPGCLLYQVHRTADPCHFLLYERYRDQAAVDAHHQTEHYRALVLGEARALLDGRDITHATTIDD